MKPLLKLSTMAALELREIVAYHHSQSPASARKVYHGIQGAMRQLPQFPLLGRVVPEFAEDHLNQYRQVVHGNYRIMYRVEPQAIVVLRIVDGRRLLTLDIAALDGSYLRNRPDQNNAGGGTLREATTEYRPRRKRPRVKS